MTAPRSSLELVRLSARWEQGLQQFFQDLLAGGDDAFFAPHPGDASSIRNVATHDGQDLYYLLVEDEKVLGYGLLRGWDEGYQIPSLGLAIHPSARGRGLGDLLMAFLHVLASRRNAAKVRLRVRADNDKALNLYKKLGYVFTHDTDQPAFLVGFKNLGPG